MIKVLHIADVHLTEHGDRKEQERCLMTAADAANERAADIVIVAGDLCNPEGAAIATEWQRNTWRTFSARASGDGKRTVLFLRGNHDVKGDFAHLVDIPNVVYVEQPCMLRPASAPYLTLTLVPWMEASWWAGPEGDLACGRRPACDTHIKTAEDRIESFLKLALQRNREEQGPLAQSIAVFHGSINGSSLGAGQMLPTSGNEPYLDAAAFEGYALAALGHIHCPQQWTVGAGTVVAYPGSPWPHTFGEADVIGRGAVLWTIYDNRVVDSERIPLPYTPRVTGHIEWREGALRWTDGSFYEGIVDAGVVALRPEDVRDKHVRLVVTYPKGVDLTEVHRLRDAALAAGARSVKIQRHSIQDAAAKVPQLAKGRGDAPQTLRAKLQAMFEAGAVPMPDAATLAWLDDACARLTSECASEGEQAVGITRYTRFAAHNIGRWHGQTVELDLSTVEGLVRLAGSNGAGKTTIMSWLGPALGYGECVNRGDVIAYGTDSAGWVEVDFEAGGSEWRARVELRPHLKNGKKRGYLWCNGQLVEGIEGKITAFHEYLETRIYGGKDRFLMTRYHGQRTAAVATSAPVSFGEAAPTDRAKLFEEVLGIRLFKAWERQALAHAGDGMDLIKSLRPVTDRLESLRAAVEEVAEQLATADLAAEQASAEAEAAKAALNAADQAHQSAREAASEAFRLRDEIGRFEADIGGRTVAAMALERAHLQAAEAATRVEQLSAAETEAIRAVEAAKLAQAGPAAALERRKDAEAEMGRLEADLRLQRDRVQALQARLDAVRSQRADAERALAQADKDLHQAKAAAAAAAEKAAQAAAVVAAAAAAREELYKEHAAATAAAEQAAQRRAEIDRTVAARRAETAAAVAKRREALLSAQHALASAEAAERAAREAEGDISDVGCAGKGPDGGWLPCRLIDRSAAKAATVPACAQASQAARDHVAMLEQASAAAAAEEAARAAEDRRQATDAAIAVDAAGATVGQIVDRGKMVRSQLDAANAAAAAADRETKAATHAAEVAERKASDARVTLATLTAGDIAERLVEAQQRCSELEAQFRACRDRRDAIQIDEEALAAVGRAEAALREARGELAAARVDLEEARAEVGRRQANVERFPPEAELRAAIGEIDAQLVAMGDVDAAKRDTLTAWLKARENYDKATQQLDAAREARARLQGEHDAKAAEIQNGQEALARMAAAELDYKRWTQLAGWTQRLATLTVDASREAVEGKVNEFLHACFGDRFVMRLEPESENKTNPGVSRTYAIFVTDTHSALAEERPLHSYSGGEQNPVRQAIAFGLQLYEAEQSRANWGVAFIDEADGGLDPIAQLRWQGMLAKFVTLGGMRQVFAVTHGGLEVADHTIDCGELGGAEVVRLEDRRSAANTDADDQALAAELPF